MQSRQGSYKVTYLGKDISKDITPFLVSLNYTDNVKQKADSIELVLDDTDFFWSTIWYPSKGDIIQISIGYEAVVMVDCGNFTVDEVEAAINPDTFTIRGISATIAEALRTRRVRAFEKQTLRKIAQVIATANGLTLFGDIDDVLIERSTQNKETDLGFLARIAGEYGYVFSVKSGKLVFTNIYLLENLAAVTSIARSELVSFSVRDKITQVYKASRVRYHDPNTGRFVTGSASGVAESSDDLETWEKAENQGQAEAKAKSLGHDANTNKIECSFQCEGNPYLLAGNNIELTGLGVFSGVYHIKSSSHQIGSGYLTNCEAKRVSTVSSDKQKPRIVRNLFNFVK
jgi:uncharacterized protein